MQSEKYPSRINQHERISKSDEKWGDGMNLISRDNLKESLMHCNGLGRRSFEAVLSVIDEQPTIETIPVEHVLEELEKEVEWTSTHGTDKMFRDGRLSGLRTAKRIVGGADMRKKV
jgi:hypothetical protein